MKNWRNYYSLRRISRATFRALNVSYNFTLKPLNNAMRLGIYKPAYANYTDLTLPYVYEHITAGNYSNDIDFITLPTLHHETRVKVPHSRRPRFSFGILITRPLITRIRDLNYFNTIRSSSTSNNYNCKYLCY